MFSTAIMTNPEKIKYIYEAIDRMSQSSVTSYVNGHTTSTLYGYDSFGRRTTEQLTGNDWQLRTSYDGFTLNAVKEQAIYRNSHTYDVMGPARTTLYAGNTPVAEKRGLTTSYFIADQTRIIAFNAGLEAVSAGDKGQSFHIVATEIRRLAGSTMNSIKVLPARQPPSTIRR